MPDIDGTLARSSPPRPPGRRASRRARPAAARVPAAGGRPARRSRPARSPRARRDRRRRTRRPRAAGGRAGAPSSGSPSREQAARRAAPRRRAPPAAPDRRARRASSSLGAAEALEVLLRQVDAPAAEVLGHVLAVLGQLQRRADPIRERDPLRLGAAEDAEHDLADGVGRERAVVPQLLPRSRSGRRAGRARLASIRRSNGSRGRPHAAMVAPSAHHQRVLGAAGERPVELRLQPVERREPILGRPPSSRRARRPAARSRRPRAGARARARGSRRLATGKFSVAARAITASSEGGMPSLGDAARRADGSSRPRVRITPGSR